MVPVPWATPPFGDWSLWQRLPCMTSNRSNDGDGAEHLGEQSCLTHPSEEGGVMPGVIARAPVRGWTGVCMLLGALFSCLMPAGVPLPDACTVSCRHS